jgi:hypothetical protein
MSNDFILNSRYIGVINGLWCGGEDSGSAEENQQIQLGGVFHGVEGINRLTLNTMQRFCHR